MSPCARFPSLNRGAERTQPVGSSCGRGPEGAGLGGPCGGAREQLYPDRSICRRSRK